MNKQIQQIRTILAKLGPWPFSFLRNSSQFSDSMWKLLTASIEVVIFSINWVMSDRPTIKAFFFKVGVQISKFKHKL